MLYLGRALRILPFARHLLTAGCAAAVALHGNLAAPLSAQGPATVGPRESVSAWRASDFRLPGLSVTLPGLGQYVHGAYLPGLALTATAVGGYVISQGRTDVLELDGHPRDGKDQLTSQAFHAAATSGFLSAWDAFHRAVPALHQQEKYLFLRSRESTRDLFTAPFDVDFLGRWTTWLDLVYTGLVTRWIIRGRDATVEYEPFLVRDAAFATSLSLNAGVGEEALFRGWLLPLFHQRLGQRFWLANSAQALMFGALHPRAGAFATVIAAWAAYEGWLTQQNGWSVRESIFHHFWYDVAVVVAELLADERQVRVRLTLPPIRF